MRASTSRLLVTAMLGFILLTPGALPAAASARAGAFAIDLEAGYPGTAHAGQWVPVTTTIRNRGPAFRGTLRVVTQWITHEPDLVRVGPYRGVPQPPTVYRLPVMLPGAGANRFTMHVLANGDLVRADLLDAADRSVAANQAALRVGAVAPVVAVISDRGNALDPLRYVHVPGSLGEVQVVRFKPEDVPPSGVLLRAFDIIAIDDATTAALSSHQRTALLDYLESGGSLLVAGGGALAEGSPPLLVEAARGQGRLLTTGMDLAAEPFATLDFLQQVVARLLPGPPARVGTGSYFGHPLLERSQRIDRLLPQLRAPELPPAGLLGLLLLAYVVLVGPLHFVLLRRMGRRHLAWVTLPAIAILVTAVAYGLALRSKGPDLLANRFRVVHLEEGWGRAYVETYTGIFVPHPGTYTVRLPGDPYVATLDGGSYGAVVGGMQRAGGRSPVDLQLLDVSAWSLRGFSTEEFAPAPGTLEQRLQLRDGRLVGMVTNRLPFALTDAVAIAGDSYQAVGEVAAGRSVAIDLPAAVAARWAGAAGPRLAASTGETRRRAQLLQALLPNAFAGDTAPVLIAWAAPPAAPLQVNGASADVRELDVFIFPLRPSSPSARR